MSDFRHTLSTKGTLNTRINVAMGKICFLKRFQAYHVDVIFINAQCCTGRKWVLAD